MSGAFIINGLRTFIGLKNKAYKNIPTEDLAGEVLRALKLQNSALGINAQMVIAGNCTSGGGYLARLAFQFIPESFCENSMIMSADETCRKNGFTAEDLIALAVESHKNAAKFIEVISPLTLPVVGLEKGRRNKAFNFSKDY